MVCEELKDAVWDALDAMPNADRLSVPLVAFVMVAMELDVPREELMRLVATAVDNYVAIVAEEGAVAT